MIRYGDEIGMGDDLSLPERNCARTPMQWSNEPHGGFSKSDQPFLPVIRLAQQLGVVHPTISTPSREKSRSQLGLLMRIFKSSQLLNILSEDHSRGNEKANTTNHAKRYGYRWYRIGGFLTTCCVPRKINQPRAWHRLAFPHVRQRVVMMAFEQPELSPRERRGRRLKPACLYARPVAPVVKA